MQAIEITDIHKTFRGKRRKQVEALKGFSLSVEQGEVFGFLGPNGAGKTTTIKLLMGLISPSSGQARIMGHDTGEPYARKHVGYLPENPSFYDFLTGEEYLSFVANTFGMGNAEIRNASERVIKLLELWDARNRPIRSYSKGMVERLGLAQALIHDPDVFILDEPMSGLDPIGRALVKDIIFDLKARGKCVFFSTHITADVETVCDRVGIIVKGSLQRVANVRSILAEGTIGYRLSFKVAGSEKTIEIDVPKDGLAKAITDLRAEGNEITLIEPKRKDLEAFFLNIVKDEK